MQAVRDMQEWPAMCKHIAQDIQDMGANSSAALGRKGEK